MGVARSNRLCKQSCHYAGFTLLLACLAVPAFGQLSLPRLSKKEATPRAHSGYSNKLAPYVSSPSHVVDEMLALAGLKAGETLYDLGCGDGRILIAAASKYRVRAVGVEISSKLAAEATDNIQKAGLAEQARVINGDLLQADFADADVVTLYLATPLNAKLRPRLERLLKNGARVISSDFPVPGWKPKHVQRSEDRNVHEVYVYEMPPVKIADDTASKN